MAGRTAAPGRMAARHTGVAPDATAAPNAAMVTRARATARHGAAAQSAAPPQRPGVAQGAGLVRRPAAARPGVAAPAGGGDRRRARDGRARPARGGSAGQARRRSRAPARAAPAANIRGPGATRPSRAPDPPPCARAGARPILPGPQVPVRDLSSSIGTPRLGKPQRTVHNRLHNATPPQATPPRPAENRSSELITKRDVSQVAAGNAGKPRGARGGYRSAHMPAGPGLGNGPVKSRCIRRFHGKADSETAGGTVIFEQEWS